MIKSLLILVALAVGFGVGVYWGVKHPVQAQKFASEEERRFVEKQKLLLEKMKRKLDEWASAQKTAGTGATAPRTGFVGAGKPGAARPDPEVEELRKESERQMQEADKLLLGHR